MPCPMGETSRCERPTCNSTVMRVNTSRLSFATRAAECPRKYWRVPLILSTPPRRPARVRVSVCRRYMGSSGNGEVILVVEDEDRVRTMTVEALRDLGYQVIAASGPQQALDQVNSIPQL